MLDDLKLDCRHFRPDRPCAPHKRSGVTCERCTDDYDPIRSEVLVVKLAAPGDVLRTTALIPAIRARYPGCRLTWLTAPDAVDLFGGNDLVDEVLSSNSLATAARLERRAFDAVLCPDSDPETAALAARATARERRGFTMDAAGNVVPLSEAAWHWMRLGIDDGLKKANTDTYQHLVADVLGLERTALGEPILVPEERDRREVAAWRARLGFDGPLVGLNTGASRRWVYKQWTLPHQRRFVEEITARGAGVLLLGGRSERDRHEELMAAARGAPVFDAGTGHTVRRFAAFVELCTAVVTGDTLALHVAAARGVPAIVLFGPTSSAEIELYGRGQKIVPEGLDCLCCYLPICDREPHCQALIAPEMVVAAVLREVGTTAS